MELTENKNDNEKENENENEYKLEFTSIPEFLSFTSNNQLNYPLPNTTENYSILIETNKLKYSLSNKFSVKIDFPNLADYVCKIRNILTNFYLEIKSTRYQL
jgi:hypothetical protein